MEINKRRFIGRYEPSQLYLIYAMCRDVMQVAIAIQTKAESSNSSKNG